MNTKEVLVSTFGLTETDAQIVQSLIRIVNGRKKVVWNYQEQAIPSDADILLLFSEAEGSGKIYTQRRQLKRLCTILIRPEGSFPPQPDESLLLIRYPLRATELLDCLDTIERNVLAIQAEEISKPKTTQVAIGEAVSPDEVHWQDTGFSHADRSGGAHAPGQPSLPAASTLPLPTEMTVTIELSAEHAPQTTKNLAHISLDTPIEQNFVSSFKKTEFEPAHGINNDKAQVSFSPEAQAPQPGVALNYGDPKEEPLQPYGVPRKEPVLPLKTQEPVIPRPAAAPRPIPPARPTAASVLALVPENVPVPFEAASQTIAPVPTPATTDNWNTRQTHTDSIDYDQPASDGYTASFVYKDTPPQPKQQTVAQLVRALNVLRQPNSNYHYLDIFCNTLGWAGRITGEKNKVFASSQFMMQSRLQQPAEVGFFFSNLIKRNTQPKLAEGDTLIVIDRDIFLWQIAFQYCHSFPRLALPVGALRLKRWPDFGVLPEFSARPGVLLATALISRNALPIKNLLTESRAAEADLACLLAVCWLCDWLSIEEPTKPNSAPADADTDADDSTQPHSSIPASGDIAPAGNARPFSGVVRSLRKLLGIKPPREEHHG